MGSVDEVTPKCFTRGLCFSPGGIKTSIEIRQKKSLEGYRSPGRSEKSYLEYAR